MTSRARTAITVGVLALALVVMGAGFPTKTVPPKKWATGLCSSMGDWRDVAVNGANELKTSLSGTNPSLADARDALAGYLKDVSSATGKVSKDIKKLGAPDTPHGKKIQKGMIKIFDNIHSDVTKLQHRAEGLSTSNQTKALGEVTSIQTDVTGVFDQFSTDFGKLKRLDAGKKLDKAFNASRACQSLQS